MTRYDYPERPTRRDERRSAPLFALMTAWAAGIIVLFVSQYLQMTLVFEHLDDADRLSTFGGRMLAIHLPNALCIALATWAAARTHREPYRDSAARHLVAALTVPVAAQLLNMSAQWSELATEGLLMSNAVLVTGCAVGLAADRLLHED
ncbi:hypothetical protein [Streptomyces sp. H27-D2]|uniref:hypothetical protein n=1 Tax=Streptomyces sp. H27-D2 TaxID=3046304 RepID=UPI002DBB19E3|nr:hypothetical protein [Streptomyces sp. H27-D2]MEC4017122.1 hypothetical protein [Streptomyces sp. H27-D2]